MKKFIIAISIITALGLNVKAQEYQCYSGSSDGFFSSGGITPSYRTETITPGLPLFESMDNQSAPLGSGLLILAGLGAAYAMRKRKND